MTSESLVCNNFSWYCCCCCCCCYYYYYYYYHHHHYYHYYYDLHYSLKYGMQPKLDH